MLSKNQIKDLQALQLKKTRDQKKLFIAEGIKTVKEILSKQPSRVDSMYATSEFLNKNIAILNKTSFNIVEVTEEELKKISLQSAPNQVMAVCKYFSPPDQLPDLLKETVFYLDDIRDPGNFGTILRLAAWFGHKSIICSPSSCDLYNPKVIQSTMGAFLSVTVHYTDLAKLSADKINIYGALLEGRNLYTEHLTTGLIVIGNEANGISENNLPLITHPITIPAGSKGGAESLNAAMAASIIASEFFRRKLNPANK